MLPCRMFEEIFLEAQLSLLNRSAFNGEVGVDVNINSDGDIEVDLNENGDPADDFQKKTDQVRLPMHQQWRPPIRVCDWTPLVCTVLGQGYALCKS